MRAHVVVLAAMLTTPPMTALAEGVRGELSVGTSADLRTIEDSPEAGTDKRGAWSGGRAWAEAIVFEARVVDDGTPPPLRPFLQRVAQFRLRAGGGGDSIDYPSSSFYGPLATDGRAGSIDVSAEGYPTRWLFLAGSFETTVLSWKPIQGYIYGGTGPPGRDLREVVWRVAATIGVRWRDVLVAAGWSVKPFQWGFGEGPLAVRFWGGAFVSVRAVVKQQFDLAATIEVLELGASAHASMTAWTRRRVGVTVAVEGAHGALPDYPNLFSRAGGELGVAWWMSPTVGASLAYAPAWQSTTPIYGGISHPSLWFVAHLLTFKATMRVGR